MYIFAMNEVSQIECWGATINLVEFVTRILYMLPPITSIVLSQAKANYLEVLPVVKFEQII